MVQVLPRLTPRPDTWANVSNTLAKLGEVASHAQMSGQQRKMDETILNQLQTNPDFTDMEKIALVSRLSPEKQASFIPLYSQVLKQQNTIKIQQEQFQQKQLQEQLKQQAKQEAEQLKEQQDNAEALEIVNELADKVEQGDVGFWNYYNKLTSKGRENRAYFDELALAIEQRLVEKVGKGSLNMQRFAYLKSLLPSSSDSDATNRGKLKALAKEFKGEVSTPSLTPKEEKEGKKAKPSLEEIFG